MTTTTRVGRTHRSFFMLLTAAAFLAAVLFASAAPASAKDHGKGHHGRKARGVQVVQPKVPRAIAFEHRGHYQPYYAGRAYYAPHRHYHATYRFPVWYGGAVAYRPYAYCDDHLFVTGAVALPPLAIGFGFGSPGGFYLNGYFAPPPPPPPYVVYGPGALHSHDDGCGHDHWDD